MKERRWKGKVLRGVARAALKGNLGQSGHEGLLATSSAAREDFLASLSFSLPLSLTIHTSQTSVPLTGRLILPCSLCCPQRGPGIQHVSWGDTHVKSKLGKPKREQLRDFTG